MNQVFLGSDCVNYQNFLSESNFRKLLSLRQKSEANKMFVLKYLMIIIINTVPYNGLGV